MFGRLEEEEINKLGSLQALIDWWAQLDSNQRPRDYEFAFKTISY